MHGKVMRETSIMDNLNCKMQAHSMQGCVKKKIIIRVSRKRCWFQGSYRKSVWTIQDDILKDDST